ncbi:hypothetical protein NECAME_15589 [Necator americanus]|uniref:Uncharacterized protein n=1 Tax=Necator americanus TaxID=51031 RepID=W2SGV2_NECAM|nr:hypothetical protein NECAME_15589 [Necator americanus]ETN68869.1 hypothetical protein NECAME_15589 [Necator americanus]
MRSRDIPDATANPKHINQMGLFIGLLACVVSSVFFGSMFVALKRCNAGDGIFAQWVTSMAILCVGYVVFWYQNFPGFYPLAMLGGLFWTVGKTLVPIFTGSDRLEKRIK